MPTAFRFRRFVIHATLALLVSRSRAEAAVTAGLATPISGSWTSVDLRTLAVRLGMLTESPILVDRRINPRLALSLEAVDEPAQTVLHRVAAQTGTELVILETAALFVPPGHATAIVHATAERRRQSASLPPQAKRLLQQRELLHWPAGARPAELLSRLAETHQLVLEGLDRVPHDHLPAVRLQPLPLAEGFDLLLVQYGLRVAWQTGEGPQQAIGRIERLPAMPMALAGNAGDPLPRRPVRPRTPSPRSPTTATYSLRVAAPLDRLLATVADRLSVSLVLDREALRNRGIFPEEIVRLSLENASRDELLDGILKPLQLSWEIRDGHLVVPKP